MFRWIQVEQDQPLGVDGVALDVLVEADDRRVEGGGEQFGSGSAGQGIGGSRHPTAHQRVRRRW
jgi:hypothetical protein